MEYTELSIICRGFHTERFHAKPAKLHAEAAKVISLRSLRENSLLSLREKISGNKTDFKTFFSQAPKINPKRLQNNRRHLRVWHRRNRGNTDAADSFFG